MLKDKVAIVVGASSGLGKAVSEQLTQEGVKVFALARKIQPVDFNPSVRKIDIDITNHENLKIAFQVIDAETKEIDILVNCAGRGLTKNLEETSEEEIHDILSLNLEANIRVSQEVYRRMLPQKSGHIINVISTSGAKARADESIYCASKWGLRGFTESLRIAATKHKIRVTSILPGGMDTNFWKNGESRDTSTYMNPDDVAREIINLIKSPSSIAPSELTIERGFN